MYNMLRRRKSHALQEGEIQTKGKSGQNLRVVRVTGKLGERWKTKCRGSKTWGRREK